MSNNLLFNENHDVKADLSNNSRSIKFNDSPLVLYHHNDHSSNSSSPLNNEHTSPQWEEFIVHLSRWNVIKKHSGFLILLLLLHYLVLGWSGVQHFNSSPRFILIGLCWLYWFYSLLSSTISESIVGMKGKGVQLEKTTFLGYKTHQLFIPIENIKHVVIAEGFHIDCVIYYLAIILKQAHKKKMVIVPFEMFNPRLNLLRKVYPKLKRVLFDE
ncbi:predicted protein [Naegleria gruberi]|uniref:Predicted protein n=1 Tax=Naegleria gruberi TaxID=5762 RepID=D2VHT5_NAEGR|nr:uncharacterized protein NAEGRDRAFT_68440 [Naegleria gruberi]EFC43649.1 predicted protein [Naegleria gruberi]|eukprot:XP_002676393.1 predicted protein [Naegleria gruberi strain NEG-M]